MADFDSISISARSMDPNMWDDPNYHFELTSENINDFRSSGGGGGNNGGQGNEKISDAYVYGPRFCEIYDAFNATCTPPIDPSRHLMALCAHYLVDFCQWARESEERAIYIKEKLMDHDYLRSEVRNGIVMVIIYTFASIKATLLDQADMFSTLQDHERGLGIANKFSLRIYNDPYNYLSFLKSSISSLIDAGVVPDNERLNQPKKSKLKYENKEEYASFMQIQLMLVTALDAGNNLVAKNLVNHVTGFWSQRGKFIRNRRFVSVLQYIQETPVPKTMPVINNNGSSNSAKGANDYISSGASVDSNSTAGISTSGNHHHHHHRDKIPSTTSASTSYANGNANISGYIMPASSSATASYYPASVSYDASSEHVFAQAVNSNGHHSNASSALDHPYAQPTSYSQPMKPSSSSNSSGVSSLSINTAIITQRNAVSAPSTIANPNPISPRSSYHNASSSATSTAPVRHSYDSATATMKPASSSSGIISHHKPPSSLSTPHNSPRTGVLHHPLSIYIFDRIGLNEWIIRQMKIYDLDLFLLSLADDTGLFLVDEGKIASIVNTTQTSSSSSMITSSPSSALMAGGRFIARQAGIMSLREEFDHVDALYASWLTRGDHHQFQEYIRRYDTHQHPHHDDTSSSSHDHEYSLLSAWQHDTSSSNHHKRPRLNPPPPSSSEMVHAHAHVCKGILVYEIATQMGFVVRKNAQLGLAHDLWCLLYPNDLYAPASSSSSSMTSSSQSFEQYVMMILPQYRAVAAHINKKEVVVKYYCHHHHTPPSSSILSGDAVGAKMWKDVPKQGDDGAYRTIGTMSQSAASLLSRLERGAVFHDFSLALL